MKRENPSYRPFLGLPLLLLLFTAGGASAQFMTMELDVEPETEARVEQSLDFGVIPSNSGLIEMNLGDPNMGVFTIRAVRTQQLSLTLEVPEYLQHPNLDSQIPMSLNLAINDFGVDNYRQAETVTENNRNFIIKSPPQTPDAVWSMAYLYVYGWIDVGAVPPGIYTADVVLHIEYQ